jgi:hypothetical protein
VLRDGGHIVEKYDPFPGCDDCGGDDGWTRCQRHADMMHVIGEVWYAGTSLSKRSRQAGGAGAHDDP